MRIGFHALLVFVLAACATQTPVPRDAAGLLNDAAFDAKLAPPRPEIFALSEAMRQYLRSDIARQVRMEGKLQGLVSALASDRQLKLDYDATRTRTAAEAFEARSGNCLALTVMTAAFARELGLTVSFRRVFVEPVWSRDGRTLVASGHVNILLAPFPAGATTSYSSIAGIIVDFQPGVVLARQRSQDIGERTVSAMFFNNRAAEAMQRGALDEAYWWARDATREDERFLEGFNTLGVIHWRRGDSARAEQAFRYVLALEAENVVALANLSGVLEGQGRSGEAAVLQAKLLRIEPHPPFHFYDLGLAALQRREYAAARENFSRELDRNASYHEAHFGLALAHLGLDDRHAAQKHLRIAQETSTSASVRDLYSAKLTRLRSGVNR